MHKRIDPFEFIYFLGYSIVKKYKLFNQRKLPAIVVSIGNITTGGTGKTPAAIAFAEEARRRKFLPVILTRGYKGRSKGPILVNFPETARRASEDVQGTPQISAEILGDEAFMMAEKLRDIPIVKYPDRYKAGQLALEKLCTTASNRQILFILDDGFQHWSLYRDVDIVLVDGMNPFGNGKILPFGILREFPYELRRADFLIITKKRNEDLYGKLRLINPKAAVFFSEYLARDIKHPDGRRASLTELTTKKVFAFCGIAQPDSFREVVLSLGFNISGWKAFPDHYSYSEKDIQNIKKLASRQNTNILLTTEKDIVKLRGYKNLSHLFYVDIEFLPEIGFYDEVFKRVLEK